MLFLSKLTTVTFIHPDVLLLRLQHAYQAVAWKSPILLYVAQSDRAFLPGAKCHGHSHME